MSDELLCWIDLETTGLDPLDDYILECGIILTKMDLTEVARQSWVFPFPIDEKPNYDQIVQDMHTKNNLWVECDEKYSDKWFSEFIWGNIVDWLDSYGEGAKLYPAGSSVHFDTSFLANDGLGGHKVYGKLYHRHFDVSSIKMLAQVAGGKYDKGPEDPHRALGDLDNDINWLKDNLSVGLSDLRTGGIIGIRWMSRS